MISQLYCILSQKTINAEQKTPEILEPKNSLAILLSLKCPQIVKINIQLFAISKQSQTPDNLNKCVKMESLITKSKTEI